MEPCDLSPMAIKQAQRKDPYCEVVIKYLQHNALPKDSKMARGILLKEADYIMLSEVLYHIWVPTRNDLGSAIPQVFVPISLRMHIMHLCHDSTVAGHLSFDKTYNSLKRKYYWPTMAKDMDQYIRSCSTCSVTKHQTWPPKPSLILLDPVHRPSHM